MSATAASGALPVADRAALRRWTRDLVGRRKRGVAVVLALLIVVTLAFSAVPAIIGAAVDLATTGGERGDLAWLVAAMVVTTIVAIAGVVVGRYEAARFGESILDELRTRVYDATVSLPASIVESVGTGELVARATGDVETLSNATRSSIPAVLFSTIASLGLTAALAVTDWRLALASIVVGVVVSSGGIRWYLRNAAERYRRERQADAARSAALLEHYTGRHTLWSFGADDLSHTVLRDRGAEQLATAAARNVLRPALRLGQAAALATVLGLGAALIEGGSLSAGALTAASLYLLRLIDPINTLLEELDELQQAKASLERIVGLIELSDDRQPSVPWPTDGATDGSAGERATDRTNGRGGASSGVGVEIVGLAFGYEPGRPVLEIERLSIAAGERLLVVGPSGAGKSTLAGLLCGTHEPWEGTIRLGGVPIAGVRREDLRRRIALVAQETHVFARSIADNVTIGRSEATLDEVVAALEAADAWPWVAGLPDGLDTVVSTSHPAITPARAQQLNLARILCLDPPIVVLDEAMADLDPQSAGRTEGRLRRALVGRTVISIAHRLDTALSVDRILMVDDGRIVADGDHASLVATPGPFADLWSAWRQVRAGRE